MKPLKGIFLTDVHMPEHINLQPIFEYVDIIDAKGMHGVESFKVSDFKKEWYLRDVKLLKDFLTKLYSIVPKAKYVYLEGNHEERFIRLMNKYPDTFKGDFNFVRDSVPEGMNLKWISYGNENSFFKLGDTIFIHGHLYPDLHSKRYALDHTPFKCIYGHLHHFQAYTTRASMATRTPRYALTPGCLCHTTPEWKKGAPNQWVNGFLSFIKDGNTVIPTVHMIERFICLLCY
jgi:hypothetical protein